MRITPDYKLLGQYLPLIQESKYTKYFDYLLDNIKGFEQNFITLLSDNDLTDHCYNLIYYAGGYAIRISLFADDIENHNTPNPFEIFNNDLDRLKSFIVERKCHAIKFIAPKNTINVESEYLIAGLMELVEKFTELQEKFPVPVNPIPDPPHRQSYYKNFCSQILNELFPYLRNETSFKNKSQNETFRFIVDFTTLLNLNWNDISEYPEDYLKDRYKKLQNS